MTNVTKLNALRRLALKVHAESPAPRKHKEWRIRLYDGDHAVGYVGYNDLMQVEAEFLDMLGIKPRPAEPPLQIAIRALHNIAVFNDGTKTERSTLMRKVASDALADIGNASRQELVEEAARKA